MENQSPIQYNIFLSGSLCVELYCHYLLCCREKKGLCWVVFGRAYHWVISSISKWSTSTDVAILVNVIPAWQHTPRKQPSQKISIFFVLFITEPAISYATWLFQVWLYIIRYQSVNEVEKKDGDEMSINIQTIVFAQSTDGEPERCWSSGWCWSQHVTERRWRRIQQSFHHCFHHLYWEGKCLRLPMTCGVMNEGR